MSEKLKSLILTSLSACVTVPTEKKHKTCIILAYAVGHDASDIRFTAMPLPKKELYTRADFLAAICKVEKVRYVSYKEYNGTEKDIYICRPATGEVVDFVARDEIQDRFTEGFSEIESDFLRFGLPTPRIKIGKRLEADISYQPKPSYERDSYEYAVTNAYSACLLGRLFSQDDFRLESEENKRVKYEVRSTHSKYASSDTLYIRPIKQDPDSPVRDYETEPFTVIDGVDRTQKIYKITYRTTLKDYLLTR